MLRRRSVAIFAILLTFAFAGSLAATDFQWTGLGDGHSWSDGDNWSPAAVPGNGDSLNLRSSFTGPTDTTNDLPAGTVFASVTNASIIRGNPVTVSTTLNATNIKTDVIAGGDLTMTFGNIDIEGNLDVGDHNVLANAYCTVRGQLLGTGQITAGALLKLLASSPFSGVIVAGVVEIQGDFPAATVSLHGPIDPSGPTLRGNGSVGTIDGAGQVELRNGARMTAQQLSLSGPLSAWNRGGLFVTPLAAGDPAPVRVLGQVTLTNDVPLSVVFTSPQHLQEFTILENVSGLPIQGRFVTPDPASDPAHRTLDEGTVFGGYTPAPNGSVRGYRITYNGHGHHDVVVTALENAHLTLAAQQSGTPGQVVLTATVTGRSDMPLPTGVVRFVDEKGVAKDVTLQNGVASLTAPDGLTYYAYYLGDYYHGQAFDEVRLVWRPSYTFTGAIDSLWSKPGNWDAQDVPPNHAVINLGSRTSVNDLDGWSVTSVENGTASGNPLIVERGWIGSAVLHMPVTSLSQDARMNHVVLDDLTLTGGTTKVFDFRVNKLSGTGVIGFDPPIDPWGTNFMTIGPGQHPFTGTIDGMTVEMTGASMPNATFRNSTVRGGGSTIGTMDHSGIIVDPTSALQPPPPVTLEHAAVLGGVALTITPGGVSRVVALADIDLSHATIDFKETQPLPAGQELVAIERPGTAPLPNATFPGLPEGATTSTWTLLPFHGSRVQLLTIHYGAGDGNDISVTPGANLTLDLSATNYARYGDPATLVAQVQSDGEMLTGEIQFFEGSHRLGSAPIDANGRAELTVAVPHGSALNAAYVKYDLRSNSIDLPLQPDPTTPALSLLHDSIAPGDDASGQVRMSCEPYCVDTVSGSMTVTIANDHFSKSSTISFSHQNTIPFSISLPNAPDDYVVSAHYSGGGMWLASDSNSVPLHVRYPATLAAFASGSKGSSPSIHAVVRPDGTATMPTGTITVIQGHTTLGAVPLDEQGRADLTPSFTPGTHTLLVTYSGDANFAPASTKVVLTVGGIGFSMEETEVAEGDERHTIQVPVTLSAAASSPVTVDFTTRDDTALAGIDYEATSGRLTFTPGQTEKTIEVTILGNSRPEASKRFVIVLLDALGGPDVLTPETAVILDNDDHPPARRRAAGH